MAWTAPMTAASNAIWTSAQWNTHVRDNLLETMVAKATAPSGDGRWFVSTAVNAIAERHIENQSVDTSETTTSTTYANLTTNGPVVTTTTGTKCLVMFGARGRNSLADTASLWSVDVAGATVIAASDTWAGSMHGAAATQDNRHCTFHLFGGSSLTTLTAGSNTFRVQYRVSAASTGTFANRHIIALPF